MSERFWSKVQKSEGCWEWQGERRPGAFCYGRFEQYLDGEILRVAAHRMAWTLEHGPIPQGLCVLHRCDNPPCVRPDHLFLGTMADNTHDMMAKGRAKFGRPPLPTNGQAQQNSAKTCCPKCGGPLVRVTLPSQGQRRRCPPCTQLAKNAYSARWRAANKIK